MNKSSRRSNRFEPPQSVINDVLLRCRRRCCLCYFLDCDEAVKEGQVAHIDRDPSNGIEENLVFLCIPHHNEYDSMPRQSKRLTPAEVKHYKTILHRKLGTAPRMWKLTIEGTLSDYTESDIHALLERLREIAGGLDISLKDISSGSIVFTLSSSGDAFNRIQNLFKEGKLSNRLGVTVSNVKIIEIDIDNWVAIAEELIEKRKFQEAIVCLNKIIEACPDDVLAWSLKASTLFELYILHDKGNVVFDRLKLAYACAARALILSPKNASIMANKAVMLFELGEAEQALSIIDAAIEIDPENAFAWFNKAAILYNLKQYDGAIQALENAAVLGDEEASLALHDARRRSWKRR